MVISIGYRSSKLHEPVVGDVEPESAAFAAGFRAGDRVESIDGHPVESWEQIALARGTYGTSKTVYSVIRESGDRAEVAVDARDRRGCVAGLTNGSLPPIAAMREKSPFSIYGAGNGDVIKSVNGAPVAKWREFEAELTKQDATKPLNVDLERAGAAGQIHSIAVAPLSQPYSANSLGLDNPALVAGKIKSGSVASRLGVESGDRLLLIQGRKITRGLRAGEIAAIMGGQRKVILDVVRGPQVHRLEGDNPNWQSIDEGEDLFDFLGITPLGKPVASANINRRDPALWLRYVMGPCS